MFKRITAVLLCLLICFSAVGCSGDDTPDGMHLVSLEGEPFKLYAPDSWVSNTSSGISGAFFTATDNIAVSARYVTPEDTEQTLSEYAEECIASYTASMKQFELSENSASVLGGADALRLMYSAEVGEKTFTFCHYITKYNGDFISLTIHAPKDIYDSYTDQFTSIVDAFVLCEKSESPTDEVTDKKTPEGMKIASADNIEYRMYVPSTWKCYSESGKSEAYYPESGKPNVTVTSYSPTEKMTAEEYFKECEKQYKESIEGYELLSESERTVSERDAKVYVYSAKYGNTEIRIMQTVFVYMDLVYSFTYTSLVDSFDAHLDDVNSMLDAFRFR